MATPPTLAAAPAAPSAAADLIPDADDYDAQLDVVRSLKSAGASRERVKSAAMKLAQLKRATWVPSGTASRRKKRRAAILVGRTPNILLSNTCRSDEWLLQLSQICGHDPQPFDYIEKVKQKGVPKRTPKIQSSKIHEGSPGTHFGPVWGSILGPFGTHLGTSNGPRKK